MGRRMASEADERRAKRERRSGIPDVNELEQRVRLAELRAREAEAELRLREASAKLKALRSSRKQSGAKRKSS